MGIRRKLGAPIFHPGRAHLLTTREAGGGNPPVGRAVRFPPTPSKPAKAASEGTGHSMQALNGLSQPFGLPSERGIALSAESASRCCPYRSIACAVGALDGSQKCDPSARNGMVPMPANCKGKPATGSFAGLWHLRMPFLFCERDTKMGLRAGKEKRRIPWQSTITK